MFLVQRAGQHAVPGTRVPRLQHRVPVRHGDPEGSAAGYDNVADTSFPRCGGSVLQDGLVFGFGTFGFPPPDTHVVEFQAPPRASRAGCPGRPGGTAHRTSSSTCGTPGWWKIFPAAGPYPHPGDADRPAAELARQTPSPTLNGHQAWLDGLVRTASGRTGA
ncbi:hypothetical protein [Streptomyces cyanogenus]|uniref:hypothetical protein n=1 Tax=Streptomyces cyanogenus TaxID=80860 RepID=UPI001AA18C14|nr:hypothetical protein [Streptomyces cyanogenus]